MFSRILFCILAALLFLSPEAWGIPFVHGWSKRFGDTDTQQAYGVAVDASGNAFITGQFYGTVNFGGSALTSAGLTDVFVAKLDAAGTHVWSKKFGDTTGQYGRSVAADPMGNVVITGYFQGTMDFGGGPLTTAGNSDIFVAKFDASGNHLWSKRFGDFNNQLAYSVATDGSGNVILTGYFAGTLDFGGGPLVSLGVYDIFIAKFDGGGTHLWSQRFGDTDSQTGTRVTADGAGNVLATGYFLGGVDFGGGTLTSGGLEDIYVAKFASDGTHLWSKRFGDGQTQQGSGIATDRLGNVVLAGTFQGTADFGGGDLTSAGSYDIYVAKYDPSGTHLWSQRFGDAGQQYGETVAFDLLGNVIITGPFFGSVDFGGGWLTVAGNSDFYLARFKPDGTHDRSQRYGGTGSQWSEEIAADALGNIVVTGYFDGSMDLGGGTLTSAGNNDVFLAKFWRAAPVIHSVRDVPGDQGGLVNLAWDASGCDTPGEHVITEYTLWRAIDAALAAEMMAAASGAEESKIRVETVGEATYYWYLVSSIDAYFLPGYSAPVPTLFDSTGTSTEYHYFQVIAHTATPYVFYTSDPDSGYSVDNLAPAAPEGLAGNQSAMPVGLELEWLSNDEADLSHYAVYRGTTPDFVPGSGNLLGELPDTTLFDDGWRWDSGYYYKVFALDTHGNRSPYALLSPDEVTGIGGYAVPPAASYLEQNTPNPFAAATRIAFGLREAADVSLVVYDVSGRVVRVLAQGPRAAERHEVEWDGRDEHHRPVASGVYFLKMKAGAFTQTRKMVVAR
jgi:hypothetical protein